MGEFNILDSMAGEKALKEKLKNDAYEASNDLSRIGGIKSIADISKIKDIYRATDFVFMKDRLSYQNLDLKVNPTAHSDGLVVCVVTTEAGTEMAFMINLSETNGLNKGDILRIDFDKVGKKSQTTFSEAFNSFIEEKFNDTIPAKDILEKLRINNYEDVVREVNKKDGFQVDKKNVIKQINAERNNDSEKDAEESREEIGLDQTLEENGIKGEEFDAIKAFCQANGILKVTGISFTSDVAKLSQKLGEPTVADRGASGVIMIRANGVDGGTKVFVIDRNGQQLFGPENNANGLEYLERVVREGDNGINVENVEDAADRDSNNRVDIGSNGITMETSEVEGENLSENVRLELEDKIRELMEELYNEINQIEQSEGDPLVKAHAIEEKCVNAHVAGLNLQKEYNTVLPGLTEKTKEIANAAISKAEKEEIKAGVLKVGEAAVGAVAGALAGEERVFGPKNADRYGF